MKIVFLLAAIFCFNEVLFSQWAGYEDPLTIKELRLTRIQKKKIKKVNNNAAAGISLLTTNDTGNEETRIKVNQIRGARIKEIRNILNPQQQFAWREKLAEHKPRRGVTGLPNEKTAH